MNLPTLTAISASIALVVLHFLRVRPQQKRIATLVFWNESAVLQQRRTLPGRLSHIPTLLLLLAIVILLSAALNGWQWKSEGTRERAVYVIDAGFSMSATNSAGKKRMELACERMSADLTRLGGAQTAIIRAGEHPRLVAGFGDPIPPKYITDPDPAPASSNESLKIALAMLSNEGKVAWYTDRTRPIANMPSEAEPRIIRRVVGETSPNAAIISAAFEPDASNLSQGRLVVRTGQWGSNSPLNVRLTIGQKVVIAPATPNAVFDDLPADGSECQAILDPGAGVQADDFMKIKLPNHPAFQFDIQPGTAPALKQALQAISPPGGLHQRTIQVVNGLPGPVSSPAIRIIHGEIAIAPNDQVELGDADLVRDLKLETSTCGSVGAVLSSEPGDVPLLMVGDKLLAVLRAGGRGDLLLSDALFASNSTIVRRAAFPILLERACRRMAGWTNLQTSGVGDRLASDLSVNPWKNESQTASGSISWQLWQWILACALVGVVIENLLHIRGRIV